MNWLETLVQMPVSEALGWTVLHSLWQGSALAAVLAVVLATTRSPRIRYVAASVALLALAGCFAVTLLNLLPPPGSGPHGRLAPLMMPLTANRFSHSGAYSLNSLIPWLAPAWLIGACLSYLRYAAAWLSTSRLRTRAACQAPARWQARLSDLAREVKISRPVVLLESLFAGTPMVLGHFRPVILTPLGFLTALPADQVEAVLLHELAHIARCDYLANVFQRLLEGLFFYHPAAWWMARLLRQEREHCCDDLVVCWRGDPYTYAATLAQLETYRQQNWPARDTAVAAKGGNLMKRITRLLYPKAPGSVWAPIVATVVLLTSGGALIAGYHAPPQSAVANTQAYWQNWLNQDVAYIIDDQEKAAFERLTQTLSANTSSSNSGNGETLRLAQAKMLSRLSTIAGSRMQISTLLQPSLATKPIEATSTSSMARRTKSMRTRTRVTNPVSKHGRTIPVPLARVECSPSSIETAQTIIDSPQLGSNATYSERD